MASYAPPIEVQDFFNHIQNLDEQTLKTHPRYVDFESFDHKHPGPLIRVDHVQTIDLQRRMSKFQLAVFDFTGRCLLSGSCPGTDRHMHGMQGYAVFGIAGFPGLRIYSKILSHELLQMGLADSVFLDYFPKHAKRTNTTEQHNVDSPSSTVVEGDYDGPRRRESTVQTPLSSELDDEDFSASKEGLIRELQQLTSTERPELPDNVKKLLNSIFPFELGDWVLHMSTAHEPTSMRCASDSREILLNLSLGSDGILVLAKPRVTTNMEKDSPCIGADSVFASETVYSETDMNSTVKFQPDPIALHLRSGDVVLLSGTDRHAWYGIARVQEGSHRRWEREWPCRSLETENQQLYDWKGCTKGKRFDIMINASPRSTDQ